jgi:hypothetical protein
MPDGRDITADQVGNERRLMVLGVGERPGEVGMVNLIDRGGLDARVREGSLDRIREQRPEGACGLRTERRRSNTQDLDTST